MGKALLLVLWASLAWSGPPPSEVRLAGPGQQAWFPGFVRFGEEIRGDTDCLDLYTSAYDGTITWCETCAKTDPCSCWVEGISAGDPGAYARHEDGIWKCSIGECFACTDLGSCDTCPAVQACIGCIAQIGDGCETTAQCCRGFCNEDGICVTVGTCTVMLGDPCTGTVECCEGFCLDGTCATGTPTTSSTSTSSSTTGTVSSSTSTSSTSTTSTSTAPVATTTSSTLALVSAFPMPLELPATQLNNNSSAPFMYCVVYRLASGISGATRISTGWAGGGNCTGAVYADDNAGVLLGSFTSTCPTSGVVTGLTASFNLAAGAQYRFCICSDTNITDYLGIYGGGGGIQALLLDSFSVSVGTSANPCTGAAIPPASTGALSPMPLNHMVPWMVIE